MHKTILKRFVISLLTFVTIFYFTMSSFLTLQINAASEPDTSQHVNLKWIVIGHGIQADNEVVSKEINQYLNEKINASLELITFPWSDFSNKMKVYMAAGENYDIGYTSYWSVDYSKIAAIGLYCNITPLIDTYAPKTKALLGKNILKGAEIDGKLYGLPVYNTSIVNSKGILLNKKLVDKYKVDTKKIKKLQDLEPVMKKIKAKNSKIINFYPFDYSGSAGIINSINYEKLYSDVSGAILQDGNSTKVVNLYETPEAKAAFSLMNKWYKAGYISKSVQTGIDYFDKNKANIFALFSDINCQTAENMLNSNGVDMLPISLTKPYIATTNAQNSIQAISYLSKNPERALMLLELVNTDEKLSNMLNYGIEGVHYKKTGAKTISQIDPTYTNYNPDTPWLFGNQTITYSTPGHNPKVWDILKESTKTAVVSPLLGFSFDQLPVLNEIAATTNIQSKYISDLNMGKSDPVVALPKLNNEFNKAGLQKVLTEMQKQVDAFVK